MFSKMKWKLIAVVLCTLVISGCGNTSSNSFEQKNDDVYVMMKEDDLYIKYPDKDAEKVASNVLEDSIQYFDGKGLIFLDDDYGLYMYENGEKQKIAKNVSDQFNAYSLSQNYKTIAYLSDGDDLYAIFDGKDKIKVASDVSYYRISSDGELIYYINEDDDLFCFSSDEQKDKIASDVDYYYTSDDGSKILIYTYDNDLYVRDLDEEDKTKILTDEELYSIMYIDNNGDLTYMSEYDYDDGEGKGELYFKSSKDESKRIASDVTSYQKDEDSFYYLDIDEKLYVRDVNEDKSKKLAENVQDYLVAGNTVYYIDGDDNLFSIKNGKKEKIGVDLTSSEYRYQASVMDEDIVFLTKDQELYFNTEKISADVESYYAYVDRVVYKTTDGALCSVSTNKLDKKEQFENPKSYSAIYYGNKLVYNSTLTAEDVTGIWQVDEDYADGFIEITKSGSSDDYLDFTFYDGYEIDEDNEYEITDATSKTITLDDEVLVTKISESKWMLSEIGDEDDYFYIFKSTGAKLDDFIEENDLYSEDDEYDSYYDEYDSYSEDDEYDSSYDDEDYY